jgi:two-component system, chemotaxis family, protein-glutamate methylesterase/glutaminase
MSTRPPGAGDRIRVLVVDDSVVIRRLVTDVLDADPQVEVVGIAQNGRIAIDKVAELKPDAITMDIEMPEMNGIQAVRAIRRTNPRIPIVMFSTLTERGASATLDALAAGASDYVTKPANVGSIAESRQNVREQLIPKVVALCGRRRAATAPGAPAGPGGPAPRSAPAAPVRTAALRGQRTAPFSVLAIGCSTGGPDALANVLPLLPGDLGVPVVVVQHMPPLFTRMLAQRLDQASKLTVVEAVEGEPVIPGKVLIAPGGFHLEVKNRGTGAIAHLTEDPPENFCRPAVDVLFRSVAATYGKNVLAVVLTGMGRDGERGAKVIRDGGGEVFVQDEATSVVWGMPGAVASSGLADRILPLGQIATDIMAVLPRKAATTGASR